MRDKVLKDLAESQNTLIFPLFGPARSSYIIASQAQVALLVDSRIQPIGLPTDSE